MVTCFYAETLEKKLCAPIGRVLQHAALDELAVAVAVARVGVLPRAADLDCALVAPPALRQVPTLHCGKSRRSLSDRSALTSLACGRHKCRPEEGSLWR